MKTKKFTRNIEDFICEKCGYNVSGDGYTNHCPECLHSKHVDINPGDRAEECQGLMEPIHVELRAGSYVILQRCVKCGFERRNKAQENDNFDKLVEYSANPK